MLFPYVLWVSSDIRSAKGSPRRRRLAVEPPETIEVESRDVTCDGGPMGHPRVFLNMGHDDHIDCPYCGRRYALKAGAAAPAAGH